MYRQFLTGFVLGLAVAAACAAAPADDDQFARQVSRLARQLEANSAAKRAAAEDALLEMAGTTAASVDRVLSALPADSEEMPLAIRDRLARIRKVIEDRAARNATAGSTVTLVAKELPIWEALQAIEKQTGNRFVDHRRQQPDAPQPNVTADFRGEPFWSAVDQLLDQANLGIYNYAGEDALAIIDRDVSDGPRHGRATYDGPFRLEVVEVQSQRNLRQPGQQSLRLQLEIAWEPRLRPIAVSQAAADLAAVDDAGHAIPVAQPTAVLGVEIPRGTQAAELVLPFELPSRTVTKIDSLRGKLQTLVPARQVKFEFDDLAHAAGESQERGGVTVAVEAVRKNNEIWEIHMRMRLDEANRALESHRGWAFDNLSYLVDAQGELIENAGLETISQKQNEIGIAYFFDVEKLDGMTWVYETPAAIVELPVDYALTDIELP